MVEPGADGGMGERQDTSVMMRTAMHRCPFHLAQEGEWTWGSSGLCVASAMCGWRVCKISGSEIERAYSGETAV